MLHLGGKLWLLKRLVSRLWHRSSTLSGPDNITRRLSEICPIDGNRPPFHKLAIKKGEDHNRLVKMKGSNWIVIFNTASPPRLDGAHSVVLCSGHQGVLVWVFSFFFHSPFSLFHPSSERARQPVDHYVVGMLQALLIVHLMKWLVRVFHHPHRGHKQMCESVTEGCDVYLEEVEQDTDFNINIQDICL